MSNIWTMSETEHPSAVNVTSTIISELILVSTFFEHNIGVFVIQRQHIYCYRSCNKSNQAIFCWGISFSSEVQAVLKSSEWVFLLAQPP